jgi:hypothetical protein
MEQEEAELQHSEEMNAAAVERIKQEAEALVSADVWFETENYIELLDGKKYALRPAKLRQAKRLMELLGTVSLDIIILNFLDTGNATDDTKRANDFFEALGIAFSNYPHVTREYLDEHCDLEMAKKILDFMIGLNGLKKG